MEFWRKKNTDTRVVFPIQKNDGTFITGATGLDSEFALYGAHAAGSPSFADCTHEATEIGTTGLYYLDVSAAEVNDDLGSAIQIKSISTGAITQVLLIHTTMNVDQTGDAYPNTDALVKGRFNRNDTDPVTGDETVYENDSTTVFRSGPIYEDIAGTMPFDGSGANRRDRMT